MVLARWGATAVFLVALPLFLVLSNVRIAASELAVYGYAFDRYDAEEVTGVGRADLDRAARDIILYFRDDRDLLDIRVAIEGREQALFNPREVLHMRDVKELMGRAFSVQELSLLYVVGYISVVYLWARERSMRHLARLVALGGGLTVAVLGLASAAVLAGFDDLFRQFHVVSFSNDLWKLDPDRDRLIQMFPRGFWYDATLGVGMLTIAEAALLVAAGLGYAFYADRRRRTPAPAATVAAPPLVAARQPVGDGPDEDAAGAPATSGEAAQGAAAKQAVGDGPDEGGAGTPATSGEAAQGAAAGQPVSDEPDGDAAGAPVSGDAPDGDAGSRPSGSDEGAP